MLVPIIAVCVIIALFTIAKNTNTSVFDVITGIVLLIAGTIFLGWIGAL